ncbi:transposase [Sulfoacidibacillus ferrooxidans]|nr:transposase [Sulfoacidibacillus ferrooxidans]
MMTEEQEKRLKEALKMTNILREIIQEAEDKGIKEGREKGLEQGHEEEKRDIARMLLKLGDSVEKISKVTGLSVEVVEQMKNE